MNRIILFIFSLLFLSIAVNAQTPAAFKYQAAVRDAGGQVLGDQPVSFRINILQGSTSGTSVYSETHTATTNAFGLVNLEVGNGVVGLGDFTAINWGMDSYFLQIELDESGGSNFQLLGTSQLMTVPYALHAKTAENVPGDTDADPTNELQDLSLTGHELTISNGSTLLLPDEINDADADPTNEIELPAGGANGQVLATDGSGNYSWTDNVGGGSTTTYAIGDLAHGGIVFYVNADGTHGLVSANIDQHDFETWYDAHDELSNPESHDAEGAKYFDWRLPTKWEITKMYENLKLAGLGNFNDFGYWNATESGSDDGSCYDFMNGGDIFVNKTTHFLHVRAVRAF